MFPGTSKAKAFLGKISVLVSMGLNVQFEGEPQCSVCSQKFRSNPVCCGGADPVRQILQGQTLNYDVLGQSL